MSSKKKRSASRRKQYKGSVSARPTITKVSAVKRNPAHQWWIDHRRVLKPMLPVAGIILVVILIIIGIITIIL